MTALVALPLLAIELAVTSSGSTRIVFAVFWVATVMLLGGLSWRRSEQPVQTLLKSLDLESIHQVTSLIGELKNQIEHCRNRQADTSQLIDDISTGLGEGLMVVDADLHLRLCNPRAQHFLGVDSFQIGASFLDLERDPGVVEGIRSAVAGTSGQHVLIENPRGVWEVSPFPLSRTGAVVLVTEVGPLRRSAELRRRFVQDLSHEIRSPLTVMRTTVEALEEEIPPDLAHMMVRQVERITRLTDELYELASIEAGTLTIEPTLQMVLPVVQQVVTDFAAVAAQAKVDLSMEVPEDISFHFDRRALSRVITNLVDNAIKYNRPGGSVTITVARLETAMKIQVKDSGLGIPSAELGAVMQRFYRVDRARTPGAGGLGLGLAIVKHMVQQMGGDLTLDSREDVGTRVTVRLPIESASPVGRP